MAEMRDATSGFPTARRWGAAIPGRTGRVAIVMRTRDRPILLPRAFRSVLSQTYADWHLYLVNDGGHASVVECCVAGHAAAFAGRITVIHNVDSHGMEAASNIGISKADGEYLVIHDDDDTWAPAFLQETTAFLTSPEKARFIAVAARPILIHERIVDGQVVELRREEWTAWTPTMDIAALLARNSFPPICLLIRMAAVREIGLYNEAMPVLGDWDFNLRLLAVGDIGTIESRLAGYHHREKTDSRYGNSVTAGVDSHTVYDALYRNSMLRATMGNPAARGLLQAMLRQMEDHKSALVRQMIEHDSLILKTLNDRFDKLERMMTRSSPERPFKMAQG